LCISTNTPSGETSVKYPRQEKWIQYVEIMNRTFNPLALKGWGTTFSFLPMRYAEGLAEKPPWVHMSSLTLSP
jgi:hypothetical protein